MTDNISSLFSGIEIQKRQQINNLMSDWISGIERKYKAEPDEELWKEGPPRSYFVADGFFPGYYNQHIKVLFIGRDTRYMTEVGDYIACTIKNYEKNKHTPFTRRQLYIVQGVKSNGKLEFEHSETVNDYAKEMLDTNDFGFAHMNISKYANELPDYQADYNFINQFLIDSNWENRNYFLREIEILDPDIIITLNLWNGKIDRHYLDVCFGKVAWEKINDEIDSKVNVSNIMLNGKNILLLNTTKHFSTQPYSDAYSKEFFYDPIMDILFKIKRFKNGN